MDNEDLELEEIRQKKLKELTAHKNEEKEQFPKSTIMVSDNTFQETIQRYHLVVVDCWAPWCSPCRMVGPIIDELARDYAGKIVFGKLSVDENQGTAMKYSIMSIPTLLIFKNGKLIDSVVGAMSKQMLEQRIAKYL